MICDVKTPRVVLDTNVLVAASRSRNGASFALSLFTYACKVAEEEHVSMNQFFVMTIAEKVSALKTETYFRERQSRGELNGFDTWLKASPDAEPMAGDELI